MASFYTIFTQFFPPKASLTEDNVPSQVGKVFIVTGGSSGVGFELSRSLYQAGGTVYCLSHHAGRGLAAIEKIKNTVDTSSDTSSPGSLHFIPLDLADLTTIYPAIRKFLAAETRLDVLFNNAGRASLPLCYKTVQSLEPHFGINCAGGWLLTQLLTPILTATAKISPPSSVRITWTSSVLVDVMAPKGGVVMEDVRTPSEQRNIHYAASKAGNWFLAYEWNRRFGASTGVVSLALNPGSLNTNTWRTTPWYHYWPYYFVLGKPIDGARTNLWAGLDKNITIEDGGRYVMPWGRWHTSTRPDITAGLKEEKDGGTGRAVEFWNWCDEVTMPFAKG
ncbi:putative oxidoreductase [Lachnellula occidentalis]|uniref:Putative oxidoreductase n=1 Tax=Lachnellula occidentalis TaxID=215460 RepID=A0A8H8RJ02_9HELO|nr:putative oxidoreductase [Lachnellula occidentalis]